MTTSVYCLFPAIRFFVYLKAVVAGIQAGLFAGAEVVGVGFALAVFGAAGEAVADGDLGAAVELFAAVAFTVLRGADAEVAGGQADAAAFHPGAVEGGVGAAGEFGAAAAAADVAVAVGGALAVAFAPAVVAAAGEADADAVADGEGDAGVPAGLAAAPGFVALFAGGFEQEAVFGGEIGTALTDDVGTGDADIGLFAGTGGGEAYLALGLDAGGGGLVAVYMVVFAVVLLAVGDGDVDRPAFAAAIE